MISMQNRDRRLQFFSARSAPPSVVCCLTKTDKPRRTAIEPDHWRIQCWKEVRLVLNRARGMPRGQPAG